MNKPMKPNTFAMLPDMDALPVKSDRATAIQPAEKMPELIQEKQSTWKAIDIDLLIGADHRDWLAKVYDLLLNLDEETDLFRYALQHSSWLNAFLLAAGMSQIVEDYLFDPGMLGRATNLLSRLAPGLSSPIVKFNNAVYRIKLALEGWIGRKHEATRWGDKLTQLVEELAVIASHPNEADPEVAQHAINSSAEILSEMQGLPARLRHEIIRLPSCFLSFDQQVEDFEHLMHEFSVKWPDRNKHLLLVGIRTSGSYLGPLYLAILKSMDYRNLSLITIRPGKFLTGHESKAFHRLIEQDGMALIIDDPPISGGTFYKTARMLEKAGVRRDNIVLLMQLFGERSALPANLATYQSIIIPLQDWNVQHYLSPEQVKKVLAEACANSTSIMDVTQIPFEEPGEIRQHAHAYYQVKLIDKNSGAQFSRLVHAKGIGAGYFADHALAVARVLDKYAPQMIALEHGLCYLDLGDEAHLLSPLNILEDSRYSDSMIEYILERNRMLKVPEDTSLKIYGRNAAWDVASEMLGKIYGRGWWTARKAFIDDYVKNLSKPVNPSVIDGDIGIHNWYVADQGDKDLLKMHLSERDFSHKDLFTYDPVYDLASLAQESQSSGQIAHIRRAYQALSGEKVNAERWTLYQLVRLWDINRDNKYPPSTIARRMSHVVQEYFSEVYFKDLTPRATGPLCVLDIDGVLETNPLGFASLTQPSARSMRALNQHGNRVILATGRSLHEVIDRCNAYHLAGGIGEYGAVIYDQTSGVSLPILTDDEQAALKQLRERLSAIESIRVDAEYRFSVRAYADGSSGELHGLNNELITSVLKEFSDRIYAIRGNQQTDFMVTRINKRVGLEQWLLHFDTSSQAEMAEAVDGKQVALAVGDSWTDIPLLSLASQAFAPAHAALNMDQADFQITGKPYQRGLEQAVAVYLGHIPGACPVCKQPTLSDETSFLLDIISSEEDRLRSMVTLTIKHYCRKVRKLRVGTK